MTEIDRMDFLGYLEIRAWNAKKESDKKKPRPTTIDRVWPGLKPNC